MSEYYQAFAGALPHHAALLNHLGTTQTQIREARTALQEAKDTLGSKRADLVQLWSRSQTVDEMMRILDQMCGFPSQSSGLKVNPILVNAYGLYRTH